MIFAPNPKKRLTKFKKTLQVGEFLNHGLNGLKDYTDKKRNYPPLAGRGWENLFKQSVAGVLRVFTVLKKTKSPRLDLPSLRKLGKSEMSEPLIYMIKRLAGLRKEIIPRWRGQGVEEFLQQSVGSVP